MKKIYFKNLFAAKAVLAAVLCSNSFAQLAPPNSECETVLDFDGGEYISVPAVNLSSGSAITLEAWVYPRTIGSGAYEIIRQDGGLDWLLSFQNNGTILSFGLNTSNGYTELDHPITASNFTNGWHHIAATYNGSQKKLYVDGVLVNTENKTGTVTFNGSIQNIGAYYNCCEYFNGRIDEVKIWSVDRSLAEIQASMNSQLNGNESGLVAYWNFNEGSGSAANDKTSNANNGTMINMESSDWRLTNTGFSCSYLTQTPPNESCGTVLDFDGSNDYVDVPDGVYFDGSSYAIESWVFPRSYANWARIIDFGNCAGCNNVLLASSVGTSGYPGLWVEGWLLQANTQLTLNQWNHVAVTWDNTNNQAIIYVNGVNAGQASITAPSNVNRVYPYIGRSNWSDPYFNGALDELRIWNVYRTEAEIQASMNVELTGTETGLAHYWNFNESIGPYAYDQTTGNSTGTLLNMDQVGDWRLGNLGDACPLSPPNNSCETVLEFDGTNEFITCSAPLDASSGTWEAWVQKDSWAAHNDDRLFGNGIDFGLANSFYLSLHGVGLYFRYGGSPDGGNTFTANTLTQSLSPGSWHHIAATWDNDGSTTTIKIYVDGNLVGSTSTSLLLNDSPVTFVGGDATNIKFGPGKLDEVRLWNVARTQSEIRESMDVQLDGDESGLVYYWDMNAGVNSPYALDKTENYNGTLRNMEVATDWKSASGGVAGNYFSSKTEVISEGSNMLIGGMYRNKSGTYYDKITTGSCDTIKEVFLKVLNTYSLTATPSGVCGTSGVSILNLSGSQSGFNYYFRNDLNDTTVSLMAGTGTLLAVGTGTVTTTTSYNVNISKPTGGLSFDGINDYADYGSVLTTATASVTLEAWFNWSGVAGGNQFIILNGNSGNSGYGILLDASGVINGILPGFTSISSGVTAVAGQWTHVAFTRSGGVWTLYINGVSTATSGSGFNTPSGNFVVGANNFGTEFFNGVIDEVRVWTVSRTASEIADNRYNCLTGNETGLRAVYKFEDGMNSSYVQDGSQYSSFLTLRNMDASSAWVSGSDACSASAYEIPETTTFNIDPALPVVSLNVAQSTICSGTTTNLIASGASSYVWQPGNIASATITVGPSSMQTYSVTGTNACGDDIQASTVDVIPSPVAVISGSLPICSGNSILSAGGGVSYVWSEAGLVASSITPSVSGVITLTATAANGCTDTETISVNPTPVADISGNLAICGSNSTNLTAYGYGATSFSWSTGAGTQMIEVSTAGTVSVTVTSAAGCGSSVSATVTENIIPDVFFAMPSSHDTLCSSLSSILLSGGLPAGGTYSGTGVTGVNVFNPVLAGEGEHSITYTVENDHCSNTASASLRVEYCAIPTGVEELSFENSVNVYPNPATDQVSVTMNVMQAGNVTLRVVDINGRIVYNSINGLNKGIYSSSIDFSSQPKGIYHLSIITESGIANKKIVVQ